MSINQRHFRVSLAGLSALALPFALGIPSANADVHVSGYASASASVAVGGSVSYGTYAEPPPPPCYRCGPPSSVPAYYVEYQTPAPPLAPVETEPAFGIGLFGAGMTVDDTDYSGGGLLARLRLADDVQIEGELGGLTRDGDEDGPEHHMAGLALLWDVFDCGDVDGYAALGAGAIHQEEAETGAGYLEVGFGLDWRLTEHIYLGADLRLGAVGQSANRGDVAYQATGPIASDDDPEAIGFSRGRLFGMVYF